MSCCTPFSHLRYRCDHVSATTVLRNAPQLGDSTRPDRLKKQHTLDSLARAKLGQERAVAAIAALGAPWQARCPGAWGHPKP